MIRRVQTRAGTRQHFYHQTEANGSSQIAGMSINNDIIRPPTSHPYSGYKSKKSQSQMRSKYCPNFFLDSKLQANLKQLKNNYQSCAIIDKLPQNFRLVVNQIRAIVRNALQTKNNEFDQLIQTLSKSINNIVTERNKLQTIKQQSDRSIEYLNTRIYQLEKKNHRYDYSNGNGYGNSYSCNTNNGNGHGNYTSEGRRIKRNNYNNSSNDSYSKVEQQILLQNCKLGELNTKYLARISELENIKQQKAQVTPIYRQNQSKADTELLRCHNRISYLEMKLNTAEKIQHELTLKNQELEAELRKVKQKYDNFYQESSKNIQKMNQWRERALMQKQDGEIHIARQQFLLYSLKKLKQNNKNLLNKVLSACKSDQKLQKKDLLQSPNFEYEIDIFKSIRTMYDKGKGQKPYTSSEVRKNQLGIQMQQVSLEADYQNYKKSDSFDVSSLRYSRPSFFSFLEQSANPQIAQSRNKCANSVSRVFIQVLRSILLSKLNQFMLSECPQKFTRFPQFVYSWFEKFYFNTEKCEIAALEPFMQKPMSQQTFYRDLMNIKLDQSWQIITFRQFILEQLSLQQLYFHLMCQMLLYSKAGITKQTLYQGDFCILVEYGAAKAVLDITLNDFQSWNITFLTSKLREKIINKKNKEYIQAGFFLRCLLEYYKIQRSNRYRYISKICSEFQDCKKGGLRFSSFMSVINKFTEVSMETKLKLYRDCYCLTKGVISPQSIFIVCSEEMIFLKHLKMKSFYRMPKILNRPSKISTSAHAQSAEQHAANKPKQKQILCLQPADPYLYDIILNFTSLLNSTDSTTPTPSAATSINKRIEMLGVSEFNHQINSIVRALDQKNSQLGSNVLKCKHFLHYFCNAVEIVRRVTFYNFYELLQEETKKKSGSFWIQLCDQDLGQIFAQEIKATFDSYKKIDELRKWKNKVYEFRVNNAAKKIQRQVKKKFIEPYLQIYNYFCHQVKQTKEQQREKQIKK